MIINKDSGGILDLLESRGHNLFDQHKLCCSETIVYLFNQGFNGPLGPETALRAGSGFCHGMGGAGCSCGALSGLVVVLGLLIGPHGEGGMAKKEFLKLVKEAHDEFKQAFGATCCRVLSKKVKHDRKLRHQNCLKLTLGGVRIGAGLLLAVRPELAGDLDLAFVKSDAAPPAGGK